jgi:hypothetical protein
MKPGGSLPCSQEPANGTIMRQMNPIHTVQTYFPPIHFNIILPFTPMSSEGHLPFRLSNKNVLISHRPHARYIPTDLILLDFIILIDSVMNTNYEILH